MYGRDEKTYKGHLFRTPKGGFAVVVSQGNRKYDLPPRNDLRNHSPDGFAWGYYGSGPAQLALALASDVLQDDRKAAEVYQALKESLVGHLPKDREWEISEQEVRKYIDEILKEELPEWHWKNVLRRSTRGGV